MARMWFLKLKRRLGQPLTLPERHKLGMALAPHEQATLGLAPWGRTQAQGRATMSARVYRAATNTWEDVK